MKKILTFVAVLLVAGCGHIPPVDVSAEVSALSGLIKVKPSFKIGDGKVGPTSVEFETAETDDD